MKKLLFALLVICIGCKSKKDGADDIPTPTPVCVKYPIKLTFYVKGKPGISYVTDYRETQNLNWTSFHNVTDGWKYSFIDSTLSCNNGCVNWNYIGNDTIAVGTLHVNTGTLGSDTSTVTQYVILNDFDTISKRSGAGHTGIVTISDCF